MKPQLSRTNREQLFFTYFMDCQTPQKPGGGADQTWDIAERAVRGLYELFAERGLEHCLGFCSEPEVAWRQSSLLQEMAANGCWQALHLQVRGYRPPGASEDYDWTRPMTWYDYDEQREVIAIAKDDWEQSMGMAADSFGACCAQANDYTFPMLGGLVLNLKFAPQTLATPASRWKLAALIRTYMQLGGFQVQVNCVSRETLLAAREDPDQYRDLVVRVAGYTDYFSNLPAAMQDEIMARTEFAEL